MSAPATLQIGLSASRSQTSGSDRYYYELLRALRAQGASLCGVVLGDPADVEPDANDLFGFAPDGSGALRRWTGLRRTVRPLVKRSDVVVSHFAPHAFPVLDIIARRPLVEHFHGPWALEGRFAHLPAPTIALRTLQERSVYGLARRIVVLSRSFGDVLRREYRVPEEKIRVIPGGVDVARFSPSISRRGARAALDLPQSRPIVVTVRRLESTKGVDRLIEAVALVRREFSDVLLVIAGTGTLADALVTLVRERGLETNVSFAGKIDDDRLALLYRAADVCVVPSQAWEGFGLTCLEALASGTPVMVTPVGGLPEAVGDLERALVFGGLGVSDIARGVSAALAGRIPVPSESGCLAYAARFAWPAIAERVARVYREVA